MAVIDVLPMTGAAAIGPIPALLSDRAGERALQRVFDLANLSIAALEAPRSPIPLRGLTDLWQHGALALGDRCFGYDGGFDMTHTTYGLWLEYCVSAPTLGAALARIPHSIGFHQTGTWFSFDQGSDAATLRYHPHWPGDCPQHSDHVIGSLMRLIQSFLGPNWRPVRVEFDYEQDPDWRQLQDRIQAPLRFGAGTTGIAVSIADLQSVHPVGGRRVLTLNDVASEAAVATTAEPLRSVHNVVAYRLLDGRCDIDGAAAMCGVGVQGLQRRLRKAGQSYRDVLTSARRVRAEMLLRETDLQVADIAFALGYEDHANFSHAFRRWTGCSPSRFRDGLKPAQFTMQHVSTAFRDG